MVGVVGLLFLPVASPCHHDPPLLTPPTNQRSVIESEHNLHLLLSLFHRPLVGEGEGEEGGYKWRVISLSFSSLATPPPWPVITSITSSIFTGDAERRSGRQGGERMEGKGW